MEQVDPRTLADAAQITPAYARMLLAGSRQPSLETALAIYDATGLQMGALGGLGPQGIETARQMARARAA